MSVAIVMDDEYTDDFYVCVSGESSYVKNWCPAIEAMGLKWAPNFQGGCFFDRTDWPEIRAELLLIKEWIIANRCKEADDLRQWYCQRFANIISEVDGHFASDNRRLWIG